jgi:hypothetical protein
LFFQTTGPNESDEKLSPQEAAEIASEDRDALRRAVKSLEHPSLAARLTNLVGKPVELFVAHDSQLLFRSLNHIGRRAANTLDLLPLSAA